MLEGSEVNSFMSANSPRPSFDSVDERVVSNEREERSTVRPMLSVQQADRTALASKIAQAERLLKTLPPTDDRVRLLGMALVRRDESLLDALLRDRVNVK